MFISHISLALIFAARDFRLPLGTAILFSILPDIAYYILDLLGLEQTVLIEEYVERDAMIPNRILSSLSHTVGGTVLLALFTFLLLLPWLSKKGISYASLFLLALSHIVLDILVHPHENIQLIPLRHDYPLGLGLWLVGGRIFHCIIEIVFLWVALWMYASRTELKQFQRGKVDWNLFVYGLTLSGTQLALGMRPLDKEPSSLLLAGALGGFIAFWRWGAHIGRQREPSINFAGPEHDHMF